MEKKTPDQPQKQTPETPSIMEAVQANLNKFVNNLSTKLTTLTQTTKDKFKQAPGGKKFLMGCLALFIAFLISMTSCVACVGILAGLGTAAVPSTPTLPVEEIISTPIVTESPEPTTTPAPIVPIITPAPTSTPSATPPPATPSPTTVIPEESTFEIHFIDVGQADAALVLCDGQAMLIDGGNSADSSLIYAYLKKHDVKHLDYMVATHAHEDHVGGLSGALNFATVGTAFCSVESYDSETFNDFIKYLEKQNKKITVPAAGNEFSLGSASVQIVGPISSTASDPNNTSIVLRIVYGETSFLFTGDAERDEEQDILDAGYTLESTVLKVGHHGSKDSTTYPFLREIMPAYAVISVGEDNSYGHPTEDALSRLHDADVKVYRTDMQGHIICTSDGKTVTFKTQKNSDADTLAVATPTPEPTPEPTEEPDEEDDSENADYIVNTNSDKFHRPGCASVKKMSEANKMYFSGSRDELIDDGYEPCKNCRP